MCVLQGDKEGVLTAQVKISNVFCSGMVDTHMLLAIYSFSIYKCNLSWEGFAVVILITTLKRSQAVTPIYAFNKADQNLNFKFIFFKWLQYSNGNLENVNYNLV